jgi:hypothetical protein
MSSNYGMGQSAVGPLTMGQISQIEIGGYSDKSKLPNKKISFDVHTAHGGYVVRVSQGGYGNEDEMYVISDEQDLGQELGKIVTHHTLAKE